MQRDAILDQINADSPAVPCPVGCIDCCTVALWSRSEWDLVPNEKREQVGMVKVPVRGPGGRRLSALLPAAENQVMQLAMRQKLAVVEVVAEGLLLHAIGLDGIRCPFADEGTGCTIYDYRPFVCRVMGAAGQTRRLRCPRGIDPAYHLPETIIMQNFLLWTNLLEIDPRYKENIP